MKTRFAWLSAALAAAAVSGLTTVAAASSHREAPAIAEDPAADNTDNYAWVDANGNLVIVANYIGLELPEGGPNWAKFSDDVLYQIHIARGASSLADAITYNIQFKTTPYTYVKENTGMQPNQLQAVPAKGQEFFAQLSGGGAFAQTYSVTKVVGGTSTSLGTGFVVPPPNVGPTTQEFQGFTSGETYEQHWIDAPSAANNAIGTLTSGEGRVFAGPRDDPFYVDLGAVFDLAQVRPVLGLLGGKNLGGVGSPAGPASQKVCTACTARDSVRYQNVHSIVLEIPGQIANGGTAVTAAPNVAQVVGIWSSASRRKVHVTRAGGYDDHYGPWRQVSRFGLPLINETVIGLQDKDYWNRTTPAQDGTVFAGYFDNLIAARDAQAVGYYQSGAPLNVCNIQSGGPPLTNRLADLGPVINLGVLGYSGANAITSVGDVLRLDLGAKNANFPNGRRLVAGSNVESVDVVDTEIKMLFCTLTNATVNATLGPNTFGTQNNPYGAIPDGVGTNETNFRTTFPYLAAPWQAFGASPHAAPAD
jgi:hypothetical protein